MQAFAPATKGDFWLQNGQKSGPEGAKRPLSGAKKEYTPART